MIGPFFSLRKSKKAFRNISRQFKRKKVSLEQHAKESIQALLQELRIAILQKDSPKAKKMAKELESAANRLMPKTSFDRTKDFIGGIIVALLIAVCIRTTWFELYTIPTGSMRPTLKEEDYLIVSKTDYGINIPLQEAHFYFDEDLVKRGSIVVFNGANMDIQDAETKYFYLFPGVKQFVKRLIGKPGDTLYFYGGNLYGVDKHGNEITTLRNNSWFDQLEHIPFIRFQGKVETPNAPKNGIFPTSIFHQMNQPVAKLSATPIGTVHGQMLGPHKNYFDLWGMKHFAMSRLLTEEQLRTIHPNVRVDKGVLYLELMHHPSINNANIGRDEYRRQRPVLRTSSSIIPLSKEHIQTLQQSLTTCRFKVKNGIAYRYGWNPQNGYGKYLPRLNIPDGTYEIQDGVAYKLPFPSVPILGIFTNGYAKKLPKDHSIYSYNIHQIQKLYNLGFEFFNQYIPHSKNDRAVPSRYAYYKNGDLYLMNHPILKKDDPTLTTFIKDEIEKKEAIHTSRTPYFPFIDEGEPTIQEILQNGIKIPEKMYLVLGDNHAMSADSRQFGFVPEDNLKGGVSTLFAPFGSRMGQPPQPKQPHATFPNLTIWVVYILAGLGTSFYYRFKLKKPL